MKELQVKKINDKSNTTILLDSITHFQKNPIKILNSSQKNSGKNLIELNFLSKKSGSRLELHPDSKKNRIYNKISEFFSDWEHDRKYYNGEDYLFHSSPEKLIKYQNLLNSQHFTENANCDSQPLKWDLMIFSALGLPLLGIETKVKLQTSANWVTKFYRNLMEFWHPEDLPFFIMAFPDKFYLWRKDQLTPDYSPNYIIDATLFLQPYFTKTGIHPQCIHGESFELMVGSWLANILNVKTSAEDLDISEQWLLESGLYQAISGGELRYDNGVDR